MKPVKGLITLTACLLVAASAQAAGFPDRTIQDIYPWGPGATMAASQVIADAMGSELGVSISVVSTTGANGAKAFQTALQKPADGYAIIDGYVAPLVVEAMQGHVNWTYKDFIPLWSATSNSFAIAVRKDESRFTDFPSFIAYAKAHPGELRYSPGVIGTLPHMVVARVLQTSGVVEQPVPYPQPDDAVKDLRGGVLDFVVLNPGVYKTNKDDIKVLAVMSELDRSSEVYGGAPKVKDFGIDLGMKGLAPMGWNWWLVRKETPPDVVAKLRDAMGKALAKDDVQKRLIDMGYVPLGYSPDQYDDILAPVATDLQHGIDAIAWEKDQLAKLGK